MKVLALCGSLRESSSNKNLLLAGQKLAAEKLQWTQFDQLAELPHFNPDLDEMDYPAVLRLIQLVRQCDVILISSPEYAHGIPGSFKNALDWLVGSDAFIDKHFALWNASTRGHHAIDALKEVLRTMSGIELEKAGCSVHILGKDISPEEIAQQHGQILRSCLTAIAEVDLIQSHPGG